MKIYNTLTRKKEEFIPLQPGKVKIYACGPTVYNYFHLGNARPFIIFDTLRRYFEYKGYQVEFCQNFTDIDDKMINIACAQKITVQELADQFIKEYYIDADNLNILRPTYQPKATEAIPEIILFISQLIEKDFAYELSDGVYYNTEMFENYGKLSHFTIEDLETGASDRVLQSSEKKKQPTDFALWKKKKPDEPAWDSPWGEGRPGWHIECSAMIAKFLGKTIDIHAGGQDLVFPHHENEIAQSEACHDAKLANYWMHNGFINIDSKKMSKSEGNFFTIRDIVEKYNYQIIRFFILSGHYRMPINFSDNLLSAAQSGFERILESVQNLKFSIQQQSKIGDAPVKSPVYDAKLGQIFLKQLTEAKQSFLQAMDDDLNTADGITAIFNVVSYSNLALKANRIEPHILQQGLELIIELSEVLGLKVGAAEASMEIPADILNLVQLRVEAKQQKDFAKADALRNQILELGYQVKDTPQGPQVMPL